MANFFPKWTNQLPWKLTVCVVVLGTAITGGITSTGASTIELVGVSVTGSVRLSGSIARITVFGSTIGGELSVAANKTPKPPTLVGNSVKGQK